MTDQHRCVVIDDDAADHCLFTITGNGVIFRRFREEFRLPLPPSGYQWRATPNELCLEDDEGPEYGSVCWDMPGGDVQCSAATGIVMWVVNALAPYWRSDD
jgi:hypothetical protein